MVAWPGRGEKRPWIRRTGELKDEVINDTAPAASRERKSTRRAVSLHGTKGGQATGRKWNGVKKVRGDILHKTLRDQEGGWKGKT